MYLKRLRLTYFRNYGREEIEFAAPKNILVGANAQGKSNLLEAVQLLIALKSHRGGRDRDLVMNGMAAAEIWADCESRCSTVELSIKLRSQSRRSLLINGVNVARQADFLGYMSGVLFSSLDLDLVRGNPEQRRDWLDGVLVQLEPIYFGLVQQYNQVLRQRNALLKTIRQGQLEQIEQLVLWDQQLASHGTHILRRRSRLIERLSPLAAKWHAQISGTGEKLEISYLSKLEFNSSQTREQVQQVFLTKLAQVSTAETTQGSSLVGPHRDDLGLQINGRTAREYGSQGQQRTLVLALKLAELELIEAVLGEPPLLLLDDVLAELDLQRQDHLLNAISSRVQTIITTTHLGSFDPRWLSAAQIFQVEQGKVSR
ncbi:MAG: DNA replication/repair protein RecF [Pseudanabaenaceae cyanobacterium bins.68]|nr:DNA replication/repair protein RecF [Pseudanabaenaceae cyanobacterium bins.68]